MADPETIANLRNMKVPPGLQNSRKFVDYLIEELEQSDTPKTPQEAAEAMKKMAALSAVSDIDVIAAIGDIDEKLQTITDVVNKQTEVIKQIAAAVNRLNGQQG